MSIDPAGVALFLVAAVVLLGSPGPAIAALLAVGRSSGFAGGLPFFSGLQLGLAAAAGVSAAGLFSLLQGAPALASGLAVAATLYLLYLAWRMATAPVGAAARDRPAQGLTFWGGVLLGLTNPKAYLAFAALMGARPVAARWADLGVKWALCVAVMVVVDLAWLAVGGMLGRVRQGPRAERVTNLAMGSAVALAAGLAWL